MKLTELNYDELTEKQKQDLVIKDVYYGAADLRREKELKTAIVVLGANTDSIKERMLTAIELLKKGYGSHIIVTDNFEPKIEEVDDGNFDIDEVPEDKVHEFQTDMMYEIAEIFQIKEERMMYFSDDLSEVDKEIGTFDRYILVTILRNVRRAILRCKKCYSNKKFVGCGTIREFADWNLSKDEVKEKYSTQIKHEAKNLIEFAKKGYIADMDVDYIFEEEDKND